MEQGQWQVEAYFYLAIISLSRVAASPHGEEAP